MFDHVGLYVADRDASERFYALVLATLGRQPTHSAAHPIEWDDLAVPPATAERPATRGLHIGFAAPSRAHVDAFWQAGHAPGDDGDRAPPPRQRVPPPPNGR